MKIILVVFNLVIILIFDSCNKSTTNATDQTAPTIVEATSCKNAPSGGNIQLTSMPVGTNVLPVTLAGNYPNSPMVSVTICEPGTSNCIVVNHVLVDTGSYGLRIFASTVSALNLTQILAPNSHGLAECAQFGIGSSWGPIATADVVLGGEPAVNIPIQMIDASYSTRPTACVGSDTSPATAGYNGILGVGLFKEDCGTSCTSANVPADIYYSCNGSVCTPSNTPLVSQVVNPIIKLPTDNNGVSLELPTIPDCGAETVTGALVIGIGTQSNNTPTATSTFLANSAGEFTTIFNGTTYTQSFIDSGTNVLFFPHINSLPFCIQSNQSSDISMFYCPYKTINLSATQISGATQNIINFKINNTYNLLSSPNYNFSDIGANWSTQFNWGLPFFYGRKVFIGIADKTSTLGTGPYWAY